MEDMKVIMATATGIMLSYVQFIHLPTLNSMRWIVLILTALYTIRRWYIMERKNRMQTYDSIVKLKIWLIRPSYLGIPILAYFIICAIVLAIILKLLLS